MNTSWSEAMGLDPKLATQSLGRPLTEVERRLAAELEAVFAEGVHEFAAVAAALVARGAPRPSGDPGPWTEAALVAELAAVNASLDAAYAEHGIGA
jgi:hypothetical protein